MPSASSEAIKFSRFDQDVGWANPQDYLLRPAWQGGDLLPAVHLPLANRRCMPIKTDVYAIFVSSIPSRPQQNAMFSYFLRPVRQFAQALVANDSPNQVAWGFVLGMAIGLVPKGNILAIGLGMVLLALQVNKSAGLVGVGLFTFVGMYLDTLAHRIGSLVLVGELLRPLHEFLFDSAISPWLGLNNTVVVGQVVIALYLAYPAYRLSHLFAIKVQARISRWLLRFRAVRWLRGLELGSQWGIDG